MRTRFTIAIPTHNRRDTVLLAVRSALAQTRPPEQVIVLCDGCSDGTAEALRGLAAPLVEVAELPKAPGYGYEHRNHSLQHARGEAILWLGDDDLLAPDHLEQIGKLWDTGRFDLVQNQAVLVHPDDSLEWVGADWSVPLAAERLAFMNSNPMGSVSLRAGLARSIGGWNAELPREGDQDLWLRALAAGARSACSPEPTVVHFRGTGRRQSWPSRVRQNTAWLEQLLDPGRQLELRIRLRRAGGEWAATYLHSATELQEELDAAHRERAALRERAAEAERLRHQLGLSEAHLAAAEARVAERDQMLSRIYDGAWWRMRTRLRSILPLARSRG